MGAEEPEQAGGPLPRELWRTHFSASSRHCADKTQQRPFSVGRARGSPVARRCLAFRTWLLGMVGGHRVSHCVQPVLGGHLQAELRKLAEGLTASTGPRKLARKRARERNRSLKPPSHPAGVLREGTVVAFWLQACPDPQRPIRYNHWDQSQPIRGGGCLKKKKEKRKNRLQSPTSIGFKFQGVKKMSQSRGLNIRSQPDQAHVALGQVHCCTAAEVARTLPLSLI